MSKIKYGKLVGVTELNDFKIVPVSPINGKNGSQMGLGGMINRLSGCGTSEGYKIETDKHTFYILIDNQSSCCENWGHIVSDEDFSKYNGKEVIEVRLTDTALNNKMLEDTESLDEGGVQFVTLIFSDNSALQFAVYNAHNGYYGHSVVVARDNKIIINDCL